MRKSIKAIGTLIILFSIAAWFCSAWSLWKYIVSPSKYKGDTDYEKDFYFKKALKYWATWLVIITLNFLCTAGFGLLLHAISYMPFLMEEQGIKQ